MRSPRTVVLVALIGSGVLLVGVAVSATRARTEIRQGGHIVACVVGGPKSWGYCDGGEEVYAFNNGRVVYVFFTHETLGGAVAAGAGRWNVWAGRRLVGRIVRRNSSHWDITCPARSGQPRLVGQAVGRDGVPAGALFLLDKAACK